MKRKMSTVGIELDEQRNILKDVFGSVEDGMGKKGLLTLITRLNLTKGLKGSRLCGIPNSGTISSPTLLMT